MITDPLAYLALEQLQRLLRSDTPPEEADQGLALLGATLASHDREARDLPADCSRQESHLLSQYLQLDLVDLERLPTAAHSWFLERLLASPAVLAERFPAIVRLYFAFNDGLLRHLTVGAMLALDRGAVQRESLLHTHAQILWRSILADEVLSPAEQESRLLELAEILLDHLDVAEKEVFGALRELGLDLGFREPHQKEHRFAELKQRLYGWTEHLGEERGARLRMMFE